MSLKHSRKRMRPQCINYKLQLIFFQHAPLNAWENNDIIVSEIKCNEKIRSRLNLILIKGIHDTDPYCDVFVFFFVCFSMHKSIETKLLRNYSQKQKSFLPSV